MGEGTGIIPDKLYFKIGEVKNITGVEPHVLRFWETEFKVIRPQRASSKQRLYRKVDVENILTIKKLLHEDGYSISGARKLLANRKKEEKSRAAAEKKQAAAPQLQKTVYNPGLLQEIKNDLQELRNLLEK